MNTISRGLRRGAALVLLASTAPLMTGGCAYQTHYDPQIVARGELTLRYRGRFEMYAGGRKVSQGLGWRGLREFVACVPEAEQHARKAQDEGSAAIAMSAMGATLGVLALGGFAGFAVEDQKYVWPFVGGGLGVATLGTVFAGLSRLYKNRANGQAVDAMNFYNDRVGSLGATCEDLRYPAPVGPAPGEPGAE